MASMDVLADQQTIIRRLGYSEIINGAGFVGQDKVDDVKTDDTVKD